MAELLLVAVIFASSLVLVLSMTVIACVNGNIFCPRTCDVEYSTNDIVTYPGPLWISKYETFCGCV